MNKYWLFFLRCSSRLPWSTSRCGCGVRLFSRADFLSGGCPVCRRRWREVARRRGFKPVEFLNKYPLGH